MLICDTHADTLYALQDKTRDASKPCDITRERLTDGHPDDTRIQALALWTGPNGLHGEEPWASFNAFTRITPARLARIRDWIGE